MTFRSTARAAAQSLGLMPLWFRYVEWRISRGERDAPRADAQGVPIPSPYLRVLVSGAADWRAFLETGEATAKRLDGYASDAGLPFRDAKRILDLGCGVGRVIRHLPKLTKADLFGVDYNTRLIGWCARNLKGEFRRNRLHPPLEFGAGDFDIVYLLSVFTHLRIPTQREWLAELARVIRPGGLALISFHDEDHVGVPDKPEARAALAAAGVFINNDEIEGSNFIATFQSRAFTAALFGDYFEVVRIIPSAEAGVGQALAVLRRRA
jgi:SAM-dependent methyltransferase